MSMDMQQTPRSTTAQQLEQIMAALLELRNDIVEVRQELAEVRQIATDAKELAAELKVVIGGPT